MIEMVGAPAAAEKRLPCPRSGRTRLQAPNADCEGGLAPRKQRRRRARGAGRTPCASPTHPHLPSPPQDLACGLFDIKDGSALAAAERAMDAGPLPAGGEGGGSDDSSDDSSDASEGPHNGGGGGEGEESGSGGESGEGGGGGCGRAGGGGSEAREGQGDVEMAEGQGGGAAAGGRAQAQTKEAVAAKRRKRLPLIQEV